jgi:lipooligosaccharide transport system permease protein
MRAIYIAERNFLVHRRNWSVVVSGFFEPVFYLFSIGVGIEQLVGDLEVGGRTVSYTEFVAPALLAASAMNGAVYESTMNIFFKLKFAKTYDAILATPVGPRDIAMGEIGYSLSRGVVYSICFLGVMAVAGLVSSPWAILAIPACTLIGFAFAACGMAATSYMRSWQDLELIFLATLPMFLFSATFYPLSTYPQGLQTVVQLTPLYHGVALLRGLVNGGVELSLLGHVVYLVVMGLAGLSVVSRRLERLLLT